MVIQRPCARGAVAILLLALMGAPIAHAAHATLAAEAAHADAASHRCCPESAPLPESPVPCQFAAPLGCCAQVGLASTPIAGDLPLVPVAFAAGAVTPFPPPPPLLAFSRDYGEHGPPLPALVRTTVLRL